MSFIAELKRRNVIRVLIAYAIFAWLVIQVVATVLPPFDLEHWVRPIILLLVVGVVPAIFFSWAFELTSTGVRRDGERPDDLVTSRRRKRVFDRVIIGLLLCAVSYFAVDKFYFSKAREATIAETARQEGVTEGRLNAIGEKSVAVLPFDNLSGDESKEYFSDGVSDQILSLLAQVKPLRVVSRSSSFSFKDTDKTTREIAEALGVAYILDGSIRLSGDVVRVSVQLIDAEADANIWAENFNRTIDDIFKIQDDIAREVSLAMDVRLVKGYPQSAVTTAQSYDIYLQAMNRIRTQQTKESYETALSMLKEVVTLDQNYALAWINKAILHQTQASRGFAPYSEAMQLAADSADEAYRIDPDFGSSVKGIIALWYERDYESAARYFRRALELIPNEGSILMNSAVLANVIGQTPRAIELAVRVPDIVPTSPIPYINLASWYADNGNYEEAEAAANKALEMVPTIYGAPAVLSRIALYRGELDQALTLSANIKQEPLKEAVSAVILDKLGREDETDSKLDTMIADHAGDWAYFIAMIYAQRDQTDEAFTWLFRAVDEQQNTNALKTDAFFKPLYSDARWEQLLERNGLSTEQVGHIEI
ncbi:MAG: tetratricopeptide repeat protein [Pseudomonadota bacterium]